VTDPDSPLHTAINTAEARGFGRGVGLPTEPPPAASLPERSPRAPEPGAIVPSHYAGCFGCGVDREHGMQMSVIAGEGLTLRAQFLVTPEHQGAPGLAHGGVLSAALDETLGSLNWLLAVSAVTGRLELDYRRPVPVGTTLFIDAEIIGRTGRRIFTRAVARLNGVDGPVAVTAAAVFVEVPLEHFTKNAHREELELALSQREVRGNLETLEINP